MKFFYFLFFLFLYSNQKNKLICPLIPVKNWIYIHKTWVNNKVIYKIIINKYDNNLIPKFINYDFDYIMYTDNITEYLYNEESIWELYPIPEEIKKLNLSYAKQYRSLKLNPHKYLPNKYNFSIFIDGNIIIKKDINIFINELKKSYGKKNFYLPIHPDRDCIYDETCLNLYFRKDPVEIIIPQISRYIKEGFPSHFGLGENNVLIRNHKNKNIIKLMEFWWNIIYNGCYRDQLSFSYAVWKNNESDFSYFNRKIFNNYFFLIRDHRKTFNINI